MPDTFHCETCNKHLGNIANGKHKLTVSSALHDNRDSKWYCSWQCAPRSLWEYKPKYQRKWKPVTHNPR